MFRTRLPLRTRSLRTCRASGAAGAQSLLNLTEKGLSTTVVWLVNKDI